MDSDQSDEDEEFSFEENIGQKPDNHDGKLNEILSEVESKIPSLEFDDDDNEDDISVWSPPENVPSFYKQHRQRVNNAAETAISMEISEASSLMFSQLDSNQEIHTTGSRNGVYDSNSCVSKESCCQTDNKLKPDISITLNEKVLKEHTSTSKNFLPTTVSSKEVSVCNISDDEQTYSSVSCQTDQSIPERYLTTGSNTTLVEPKFASDQQKSNVSFLTEKNYPRNTRVDDGQVFDSRKRNIELDEDVLHPSGEIEKMPDSVDENEYEDQLDFNLLNEINFNELQSVLETLPSSHAISVSDLYPSSAQPDAESVNARDDELMLKLCDLSKDQLSSCSSVLDDQRNMTESMYQKKRKVKGNRGSTRAIHTWSQLGSDDTSNQEPQTIFLDLRPEANLEKEKEEEAYSESIQRILGLNKKRCDSWSESGSDEELSEWHEMRTKIKKKAKEEPEKHKESAQFTRNSIRSLKEKVAYFPCDIPIASVEKLLEEELTGGLPTDTSDRYENVAGNGTEICTGNSQIHKKNSVEIQADKCTHNARTLKTEVDISSRSEIDEYIKSDECKSEVIVNEQCVSRTLAQDESLAEVKLDLEKLKAENHHFNRSKVEKDKAYSKCHPTVSVVHAGDPADERGNIFLHENTEYNSSSGSVNHEKRSEEIAVAECYENMLNVQLDELDEKTASTIDRNERKQLLHHAANARIIGYTAKSLPVSVKSDNQKESDSISTADIRISLRLSGNNDEMEERFEKREETGDLGKFRICTGVMEQSSYKKKIKLPKAISGQKADKSISSMAHNEVSEEKTSIINDVDYMKEEKEKQYQRPTTPNSGDNQQKGKSKLDTRSANSSETANQQKQRSQKELKKLKEKLRINLENMRHVVTASGKYPAAYNTPIIYDQDASFERQHHGLLFAREDQLELLLVVTLSGCGEVNNQYSKGRTFGSGCDVNFYFALLAWFLHLCGPNKSDCTVPFVVAGMQQTCQNGLLQLFVGVQPNEKVFYPNTSKGSKKNKTRAFHKAVSKYLSTHSLRLVYQNMENVYLNGSCQVDENSYSSKMLSTCITVGQDSNAVRRVFNSKPGFFWETMELEGSNDVFQDSHSCDVNVENTIVFVRAPLYYQPSCVLDLLTRIENDGCDLAGLRLANEPQSSAGTVYSNGEHEIHESICVRQPATFVLAVRGPFAITKVKKMIGSKIPYLDDSREIPSLRSLYCSTSTEDKLFYCPSYSNQAATQLARVFGGRLTESDVVAVENNKSSNKSKPHSPEGVPAQKPHAFLVSSVRVAFHLIISPLVPPGFFGELLHICFLRGFVLHGMRRVQLSKRQGTSLGLSQLQFHVFCPSSGNTPVQSPSGSPPGSPARRRSSFSLEATLALTKTYRSSPSTILVLQKENGLYHAVSLVKHLFASFKDWMATNPTGLLDLEETSPTMYLTIAQFSEASSKSLWGDICNNPDAKCIKHARNSRFPSSSEVEQVCVLSSVNKKAIQHLGLLLKKLTNSNHIAGDWELLGMKSFPSLSLVQAREVTPYEVGDRSWLRSVKLLMSAAVFVCVLRGIDIIRRVRDFFSALAKMSSKEDSCLYEGWWFSQTTEVTYRQLVVLFEETELFSDERSRANIKYVPPLRQKSLQSSKDSKESLQKLRRKLYDHKAYSTDDSSTSAETTHFSEVPIIQSLLAGPRPLPTVAVIKPSCVVNTKKISKILKSVLQENFDIMALSMRVLTRSEAQVLVRDDEPNYDGHIQYLTSGSSLVICLRRENAVKKLLDILGPEDPVIARSLDPFLLRGCYGVDVIHNAIHGSESYSSAICEMKMLFPCGVCCEQTIDLEAEQIPCRTFDAAIGKKTNSKLTKCLTHSTDTANSLINSLLQVNCVVLTHQVVYGRSDRKRVALVDVLDCLLSANFVLVGMKMAMLSHEQVSELLTLIGSKSHKKQGKELTKGPCIILALQRDNAVTCFDSIIGSVGGKQRSITEYRKHIIEAKTEEEANNLLMYFFDVLSPSSVQQISPV